MRRLGATHLSWNGHDGRFLRDSRGSAHSRPAREKKRCSAACATCDGPLLQWPQNGERATATEASVRTAPRGMCGTRVVCAWRQGAGGKRHGQRAQMRCNVFFEGGGTKAGEILGPRPNFHVLERHTPAPVRSMGRIGRCDTVVCRITYQLLRVDE